MYFNVRPVALLRNLPPFCPGSGQGLIYSKGLNSPEVWAADAWAAEARPTAATGARPTASRPLGIAARGARAGVHVAFCGAFVAFCWRLRSQLSMSRVVLLDMALNCAPLGVHLCSSPTSGGFLFLDPTRECWRRMLVDFL